MFIIYILHSSLNVELFPLTELFIEQLFLSEFLDKFTIFKIFMHSIQVSVFCYKANCFNNDIRLCLILFCLFKLFYINCIILYFILFIS